MGSRRERRENTYLLVFSFQKFTKAPRWAFTKAPPFLHENLYKKKAEIDG